jgi:hypothetical protein
VDLAAIGIAGGTAGFSGSVTTPSAIAAMADVVPETEMSACRDIYAAHEASPHILNRWELRQALAEHFGVSPCFLRSTKHQTVLPLGVVQERITFYGGGIYCERNGFLGPGGGETAILESISQDERTIRLLSWKSDPVGFLPASMSTWDVPYNQYWILPAYDSFDRYLDALSDSRAQHARYLMRRFRIETIVSPDLRVWMPMIDGMMEQTVAAFRRRGHASVYEDGKVRKAIELTIRICAEPGALIITSVMQDNKRVGLGVTLREPAADKCVYLLNLYSAEVNDASAAVLLSVINYACDGRMSVDGLRGAFGLKKKYGFLPRSSYALVRDPRWRVQSQTDLSDAELRTLYGREFHARPH